MEREKREEERKEREESPVSLTKFLDLPLIPFYVVIVITHTESVIFQLQASIKSKTVLTHNKTVELVIN